MKKTKDMMIKKYNVDHYSQTQEYKEKWNKTCEDRYGDDYRKQFADQAFKTFREKTGYDYPSQSPAVREKIIESYMANYNVCNPQLSLEIRERTEKTCIERYGYSSPLQSEEVKEKIANSSYRNGTVPMSRQQLYLFNLYKTTSDFVELNYPISHFNADICFVKEAIDIELDCGGHNLSVKTGQLTEEQFNQKELIRDKIIKREGYNVIRIKSNSDKLPNDNVLLRMLFEAKKYFSNYPNHSWIEYDIDNSIVLNAEHIGGILYDYGTLRRINDSDLIT